MNGKYIALLLMSLPGAVFAADAPKKWNMDVDSSFVRWTVNYGGRPVKGIFPAFSADMMFDPAHPETGKVKITLPMASMASNDKDAQKNLPGSDWFDMKQYPVASFESHHFSRLKTGGYQADGTLTIHGKSVPVKLPFSVQLSDGGKYAVMDAATSVNRLDFGVGSGDWAKTDVVANAVKVIVHVEAKAD